MSYAISIVGATGLVGTTLLALFEQRGFPISQLHLVASKQSAGQQITFRNQPHTIQDLATFDFKQTQLAFFCVSNQLAETYVPRATAAGNIVIDKSYFYRMHDDVPLIVPEVNANAIPAYKKMNIIANPNCSTIPIAVALKPLYDAVGITRMNVATYQAVSGTGKEAVAELQEQVQQLQKHQSIHPKVYPQQIAFNVLPHIDDFQENGYTREEMKIVWEMQKIFNDPTLAINPTTVRVPVYYGHAAAIHLETSDKLTAKQAISLLSNAPSVRLMSGQFPYATPVQEAAGNDDVYVGRVREDISHPTGLNLWVVSDNLRKGAALNAIQIADQLIAGNWLS